MEVFRPTIQTKAAEHALWKKSDGGTRSEKGRQTDGAVSTQRESQTDKCTVWQKEKLGSGNEPGLLDQQGSWEDVCRPELQAAAAHITVCLPSCWVGNSLNVYLTEQGRRKIMILVQVSRILSLLHQCFYWIYFLPNWYTAETRNVKTIVVFSTVTGPKTTPWHHIQPTKYISDSVLLGWC